MTSLLTTLILRHVHAEPITFSGTTAIGYALIVIQLLSGDGTRMLVVGPLLLDSEKNT